jgi:hypothetical protein
MDTAEQAIERQCRQVMDFYRPLSANLKADNIQYEQLITAIVEGIVPVVRRHLAREIAKGTDTLKKRVLELELKQRARRKVVKAIERRRPVKCF